MVQVNIMTRVKALPQELKDEVLEYAIVVEDGTVRLNRLYKPPVGLSINHATRQKTAPLFYANTLFLEPLKHQGMMLKWLTSLPSEHRHFIKAIRFQSNQTLDSPPVGDRRGGRGSGALHSRHLSTVSGLAGNAVWRVKWALLSKNIELGKEVLQVELLKEGGVWLRREVVRAGPDLEAVRISD